MPVSNVKVFKIKRNGKLPMKNLSNKIRAYNWHSTDVTVIYWIVMIFENKTTTKNQIKNAKMLSGQRAVTPNFENNLFLFSTHLLCFFLV